MNKCSLQYLLLGLGLLSLYGCPGEWDETYRYNKTNAFDTYALYELLAARPEGLVHVKDSLGILEIDTLERANYLFVGNRPYYDERAVTHLLNFVERGNTALIAAYDMTEDLAYHLIGEECLYDNQDYYGYQTTSPVPTDSVIIIGDENGDTLHVPVFVTQYHYREPVYALLPGMICNQMPENEIVDEFLLDPVFDVDGEMLYYDSSGILSARFPWGKGEFLFLAHPRYLTNYYVADERHHRYAKSLVGRLGEGPVYWDEFSRVPPSVDAPPAPAGQTNQNYYGGRNLLSGNQALRYIQEQPALALAWYTLVAAGLLFVVFRGKRRQRVIPEINPRENSSKRFIDTISRLVYQKGNHRALARREVAQLRYHLNERYHLRWREGEPPPPDLPQRLGLDAKTGQRALVEIVAAQKGYDFGEGDLLRLHRALEPLYKL